MSEPYIEKDIEIHFTHGEPLSVYGLREDKDDVFLADDGRGTMLVLQHIDGGAVRHTLSLQHVRGVSVTTRTVTPEPQIPEGLTV